MEVDPAKQALEKAKKSSSESLSRRLVEYGFATEAVETWSRDQLINETLAMQGYAESKMFTLKQTVLGAEASPIVAEPTTVSPDIAELIKALQQNQADMMHHFTKLHEDKMREDSHARRQEQEQLRGERQAREESKAAQIKRYGELLKHVLYKFPDESNEINMWLDNAQSIFETYEVPDEIRSSLLMPYFNEKSKRLVCKMTNQVKTDFEQFKTAFQKEFKLTANTDQHL